jgi:hypothetical protein
MDEFAFGLDININTIDEDFEINIENKTVHTIAGFNDVKYSYTTIVPYLELGSPQQIFCKEANIIRKDVRRQNEGSTNKQSSDKKNEYEIKKDTNKPYNLSGRFVVSLHKPRYPVNDEGNVVVKISVDKNGKVASAEPGVEGTTTSNKLLWSESKQAALKAIFNIDENAPDLQQGTITYKFILD